MTSLTTFQQLLISCSLGFLAGFSSNLAINFIPKSILKQSSEDILNKTHSVTYQYECFDFLGIRSVYLPFFISYFINFSKLGHIKKLPGMGVELLSVIIWVGNYLHFGFGFNFLLWSIFCSFIFTLSVIDLHYYLLPDILTQLLLWLGIIASLCDLMPLSLHQSVLGAVIGYVSLWITASLFECTTGKVGMGNGDFKFLAALGAWLGPFAILPLLLISSLLGIFIGLIFERNSKPFSDRFLPFGPFMSIAGVLIAYIPYILLTLLDSK